MEFLTTPDISSGARWASTTPLHPNPTPGAFQPNTARLTASATPNHPAVSAVPSPANPPDDPSKPPTVPVASPPKGAVKVEDGKLVLNPRATIVNAPVSSMPMRPAVVPSPQGGGFPPIPGSTSFTPRPQPSPAYPHLDRAGIKNSFQSLFSPAPHASIATPALMGRTPGPPPGLTPFLNGVATPSLVPPSTNMLNHYPPHLRPSPHHGHTPTSEIFMSSPYLQAAAKEAVRREFMNMPNYVTPPTPRSDANASAERAVPVPPTSAAPASSPGAPMSSPPEKTVTNSTAQHPIPASTAVPTSSSPSTVPTHPSEHTAGSSSTNPTSNPSSVPTEKPDSSQDPSDAKVPNADASSHSASKQQPGYNYSHPVHVHQPPVPMHPFFMSHPQPQPGMMLVGSHPHMMMAPPPHPGAMYGPPPGMMMFPGGAPVMPQQGVVMPQPSGQASPAQTVHVHSQVRTESHDDKKSRIEQEKQELIREFKKKTREAALVRFRQKRRERRFGKLIRYDCRKKLADARPRVKGRFVRIKSDEFDEDYEGAQVVPDLAES